MNTLTFNSTNVEKLNEMLNTQVFNWMLAKEKAITENGVCEQTTSCPSTGIIGIAAEVEDVTPSELVGRYVICFRANTKLSLTLLQQTRRTTPSHILFASRLVVTRLSTTMVLPTFTTRTTASSLRLDLLSRYALLIRTRLRKH
jgi:hypothetical protein